MRYARKAYLVGDRFGHLAGHKAGDRIGDDAMTHPGGS
jgi:hypothetical protein